MTSCLWLVHILLMLVSGVEKKVYVCKCSWCSDNNTGHIKMRSDGDQMCEILINVPYYIVMAQMTFYAGRKIFNFRAPQGIDYEIPWFFPDIIKFPDSLSAENIAKHKYKCSSTTCSDHYIPELLLNWLICVQQDINISRQCGYSSHYIICVLNKFPDIFRNFQIPRLFLIYKAIFKFPDAYLRGILFTVFHDFPDFFLKWIFTKPKRS